MTITRGTSRAMWNLETAMSLKPRISIEELRNALNEALRRRADCAGFRVSRILQCADGPSNWDAEFAHDHGDGIDPKCKRAALAAKLGLQNRFDLAG